MIKADRVRTFYAVRYMLINHIVSIIVLVQSARESF